MSPKPLRKLVFTRQPPNAVVGENFGPVQVVVMDDLGQLEEPFDGKISVALDQQPIPRDAIPPGPPKGVPKRLRATAPGCVDAISNVFFLLPK
jgi:hypothetical protein